MSASRRAFVLLAMLVAIGTAMLLTSAVIWAARSEHAGRVATTDGIRRRAAAWSAAQAVAAELGSQRPLVLSGGTPSLDPQLILHEDGASTAILRLLPAAADGRTIVAEAALLDANGASAGALVAAGLDEKVAGMVVAARSGAGGALGALEEVVDRPGASPSILRGEHAFDHETMAIVKGLRGGEAGRALSNAGSALDGAGRRLEGAGSRLERAGDRPGGAESRGGDPSSEAPPSHAMEPQSLSARGAALADVASVFVVEPALTRRGERRIELDEAWAELLRDRLSAHLDETRLRRLEALSKKGSPIESDQALVDAIASIGVRPEHWPELLDEVTAEPGAWRWGRIDINRAEEAVIATLPSISAEQAARIVRARDSLDPNERSTPVWPVLRDIVEPEQFAALFPAITTRSFFWRVRFVAGFTDEHDVDGAMSGLSIWECVVDLTDERPRIASLRDLSLAPTLERLMAERTTRSSEDDETDSIAASTEIVTGDADPLADAEGGASTALDEDGARADDSEPRAASEADESEAPSRRSRPDASRRPAKRERAGSSARPDASDRSDGASNGARDGDAAAGASEPGAAEPSASRRPGSPPPVGRYRPRSGRPSAGAADRASPPLPASRSAAGNDSSS
ncbi:MAG: hypothetical protein FJ253_01315 [Phycisphaerae bacterium]|nr:hypothetical protein [Phycisphaerae bacterium]